MVSLKHLHSFGFSVNANNLFTISSQQDLIDLSALHESTTYYVLGEGSNTIFTQDYEGTVVLNRLTGIELSEDDRYFRLSVASGENWHNLVQWCLTKQINGFENLALIPGTVGAAPIQNIGAYGVEAEQFIESVEYFDIVTQQHLVMTHKNAQFAYRDSTFKSGNLSPFFITKVNFCLPKAYSPVAHYAPLDTIKDPTALDIFNTVITTRKSKLPDPDVLGNAGSFFKNPVVDVDLYQQILKKHSGCPSFSVDDHHVKIPAAWLIDTAGYKGKTLNDIACYQKQPLVLVNQGDGKGEDLIHLARQIMKAVQDKYAVTLENEVRIIGARGLIVL